MMTEWDRGLQPSLEGKFQMQLWMRWRRWKSVNHIEVLGQRLPMETCEDYIDLSFMEEDRADMVSEAICNTKIGMVRNHLQDRLKEYMVAHYCEEEPTDGNSGGSIFASDILMGLPLEEREDHWIHDETTAAWTRIIVVPRKELYIQKRSPLPR